MALSLRWGDDSSLQVVLPYIIYEIGLVGPLVVIVFVLAVFGCGYLLGSHLPSGNISRTTREITLPSGQVVTAWTPHRRS